MEAHSVSSWEQSWKHFSKIKEAVDGGEQGETPSCACQMLSPFWGTQGATQLQPPLLAPLPRHLYTWVIEARLQASPDKGNMQPRDQMGLIPAVPCPEVSQSAFLANYREKFKSRFSFP